MGSWVYLVAIMDLHSRKILSWKLSNTMSAGFCVEALEEALTKYGKPEIFNTDQGSQYTSLAFTSVLRENQIEISMDGVGRAIDNVYIERFWRSVKYELVHLNVSQRMTELRLKLEKYIYFYNQRRPHQALRYATPEEAYSELTETSRGVVQSGPLPRKIEAVILMKFVLAISLGNVLIFGQREMHLKD